MTTLKDLEQRIEELEQQVRELNPRLGPVKQLSGHCTGKKNLDGSVDIGVAPSVCTHGFHLCLICDTQTLEEKFLDTGISTDDQKGAITTAMLSSYSAEKLAHIAETHYADAIKEAEVNSYRAGLNDRFKGRLDEILQKRTQEGREEAIAELRQKVESLRKDYRDSTVDDIIKVLFSNGEGI